MSYVINGATGAQGASVAAALVAAGKPVVALTRRTDAVVEGARVQAVDVSSIAALTDAYRGAEGVFVHLPMGTEQDREPMPVTALPRSCSVARPGPPASGWQT